MVFATKTTYIIVVNNYRNWQDLFAPKSCKAKSSENIQKPRKFSKKQSKHELYIFFWGDGGCGLKTYEGVAYFLNGLSGYYEEII